MAVAQDLAADGRGAHADRSRDRGEAFLPVQALLDHEAVVYRQMPVLSLRHCCLLSAPEGYWKDKGNLPDLMRRPLRFRCQLRITIFYVSVCQGLSANYNVKYGLGNFCLKI